jgi:kumamolisin
MTVTVFLRGPGQSLTQRVAELERTPPHEREYLTPQEFAKDFGAQEADVADVAAFAANNGLTVLAVHRGMRTVQLGGTTAALSAAFGVRVHLFWGRRGLFRVPSGPLWVPESLRPAIAAVLGFDTRPIATPNIRHAPGMSSGTFTFAAAPGQRYTPPQVAELYEFPSGTDGTGQSIGIIELGGGFQQSDLDQYFQGLGISPSPTVTAVPVQGGSNRPTGSPLGPDAEVMLDIEIIGSIAPKAKIAVYFGPNTDNGFAATLLAAIHDTTHRPSIISISWGAPEYRWPAQARFAMNEALLAGLAMGVTVFVAAGDSGSSDGGPSWFAQVDFPASSPLAVGCGGTRLIGSGTTIASETVWNDPGDGATGGGVSGIFAVPPFQSSIGPVSANPAHRPGRGVPDVAGNASPTSGYEILVDGQSEVVGGTSAVAPLWSGLLARLQQQLGHSAAPLLPAIYATSNGFRDITVGSNGAYHAGPGWDPCTGLGSPNGSALLSALRPATTSQSKAGSARETHKKTD